MWNGYKCASTQRQGPPAPVCVDGIRVCGAPAPKDGERKGDDV